MPLQGACIFSDAEKSYITWIVPFSDYTRPDSIIISDTIGIKSSLDSIYAIV